MNFAAQHRVANTLEKQIEILALVFKSIMPQIKSNWFTIT